MPRELTEPPKSGLVLKSNQGWGDPEPFTTKANLRLPEEERATCELKGLSGDLATAVSSFASEKGYYAPEHVRLIVRRNVRNLKNVIVNAGTEEDPRYLELTDGDDLLEYAPVYCTNIVSRLYVRAFVTEGEAEKSEGSPASSPKDSGDAPN